MRGGSCSCVQYARCMYTRQAEWGRILNESPYYSDDRATLYGGDALAVLAALPMARAEQRETP